MTMMRWEPFPELMSLRQAMDRLFEDSFIRPSRLVSGLGEGSWPSIDMYQADDRVVVKAAVPGVKAEDLDVHITADGLTIKGERREEQEVKREDYLYQETRYGTFSRHVSLPDGLATDRAEASVDEGVLTLTIPRAEGAKTKTVKIRESKPAQPKKIAPRQARDTRKSQ